MRRGVIVSPSERGERVLSYPCLERRVGSRKGCNTGQRETLFVRAKERSSAPATPEQSGRYGRARIDGLNAQAAKRFFSKMLAAPHTVPPCVITVDKNAAYPKAFNQLQEDGILPKSYVLRQSTYLNNLVKLGMGSFSFETAWRTLQGYEMMNMLRKGQIRGVEKRDSLKQATFITSLFRVAI